MTGGILADDGHVVRYVKPRLVEDDGQVNGAAFLLRSGESGLSISIHWLEAFGAIGRPDQLAEVRSRSRLQMSRNGRLAELPVGDTRRRVRAEAGPEILFVRDPLRETDRFPEDPSHSLITGLPAEDSLEADRIAELIAECVTATWSTADPPAEGEPAPRAG